MAVRYDDRAGRAGGANLCTCRRHLKLSETTAARRRLGRLGGRLGGSREPGSLEAKRRRTGVGRLGYLVRSICSMWSRLFLCVVSKYNSRWPSLSTSVSRVWV